MDIYISNEEKYPIAPNYCPNCGAKIDHEELMKRYYDASIDFGKWMKEHTDVDGNIIIPNEELNR